MGKIKREEQREVLIPQSIYTVWGGRANIVEFLRNGYSKMYNQKKDLKERLKDAEVVIEFYADQSIYEGTYYGDDDYLEPSVDSEKAREYQRKYTDE